MKNETIIFTIFLDASIPVFIFIIESLTLSALIAVLTIFPYSIIQKFLVLSF